MGTTTDPSQPRCRRVTTPGRRGATASLTSPPIPEQPTIRRSPRPPGRPAELAAPRGIRQRRSWRAAHLAGAGVLRRIAFGHSPARRDAELLLSRSAPCSGGRGVGCVAAEGWPGWGCGYVGQTVGNGLANLLHRIGIERTRERLLRRWDVRGGVRPDPPSPRLGQLVPQAPGRCPLGRGNAVPLCHCCHDGLAAWRARRVRA
jgi:hypothetical protein